MKNIIYIHICCINNYRQVVNQLFYDIKQSGLYDIVQEIRCCILGNYDPELFIDKKIKIRYTSNNLQLYEVVTINTIYNDAMQDDFNILYLHSKGVTKPDNLAVKSWVEYMSYFNIYQYNTCINLLKENDTVGVNLQNNDQYPCHYSGNFWWSKSSYIRKLMPCTYYSYNSPEFWLTEKKIGKYIELWVSNTPHYISIYNREEYINKDITPYILDFTNNLNGLS